MSRTLLPGFGVANYRSFGPDMQYAGPFGSVNLLAGQNNAGKSNFLRVVMKVLGRGAIQLDELDAPDMPRGREDDFSFALPVDITEELLVEVFPVLRDKWKFSSAPPFIRELLQNDTLHPDGSERTWFRYDKERSLDAEFLRRIAPPGLYQKSVDAAQHLGMSFSQGDPVQSTINNVSSILRSLIPSPQGTLPSCVTIEAFRKITPAEAMDSYGGAGLLEKLQQLQNPPATSYRQDVARFEAINSFLRSVLGDGDARLEVPYGAQTVNVHHDGRVLPLEHLGTGIHQVVILAVAAMVLENTVMCIEEPEVHMHPEYQRKLITYLVNKTNNQYLIATHSAHLLDYRSSTVIHVRHDGQHSRLTPATSPAQLSDVCVDLGYRPSDILQTNAIIWVEGPSDRIYVQHWVSLMMPDFVEGLHYSIMFYGGRLLNQLTASDEEVSDFISLRRLNRRTSIVIDSDKLSARARISGTKRRVIEEFDSDSTGGFAWLTEGYTIENYVPVERLKEAVREVHPSAPTFSWDGDRWANPLALKRASGQHFSVDKNKIARVVCRDWGEIPESGSHLRRQLAKIVSFIESANRGF
ncbi:AAA family ATPase [Streptomyces decoyicus]